jgi:rod shape-determining protein MreC
VASVAKIDRKIDSGFARIVLVPAAQSDGVRHVLVLEPTGLRLPPRPQPSASEAAATSKAPGKKGGRK